MNDTWERLKRNHPDDEIVSEGENPTAYAFLFRFNRTVFFATIAAGILASIIPFNLIKTTFFYDVSVNIGEFFPAIRSNYIYLENARLGFGRAYLAVILFSLTLTSMYILIIIAYFLINRGINLRRLSRFQYKSIFYRLLMALVCASIVFLLDMSELAGGRSSNYGNFYSAYMHVFTVSFCLAVVASFFSFIIPCSIKLVRYRGEIIND
jgi:hypothetical protein